MKSSFNSINSSAPIRIDCGGTYDLPTLSLSNRNFSPTTVNFTLSCRVNINIQPYVSKKVKVTEDRFESEEDSLEKASFLSPLGIFFYLCKIFDIDGVHIKINSNHPIKSGLGGSSASIVAAIAALDMISPLWKGKRLNTTEIAYLAYLAESSIHFCGYQDHLAAAFGGVNAWLWKFEKQNKLYQRKTLVDKHHLEALSKRIAIVYTGLPHKSSETTKQWVEEYLEGKNRILWNKSNLATINFSQAIMNRKWTMAQKYLADETDIRKHICPKAITTNMEPFIEEAKKLDCATRYAGGGGSSLWAFGTPGRIKELRASWSRVTQSVLGSKILDYKISHTGVKAWKN